MSRKKPMSRVKLNVYLDLALALAFAIQLEINVTGESIHELLGLAFGVALIVHIALHWQWIVSMSRTFFVKLIHISRVKYVLNMLLFIDMLITVISGVLINETLWVQFNLTGPGRFPWKDIHILASGITLLLVGLHVATSWQWIATNTAKLFNNFLSLARKRVSRTSATTTDSAQ